MNNNLILSQYKIIDILTDLDYQKVYLTENIKQNNQLCIVKQYFLNSFTDDAITKFIESRKKINDFCQNDSYFRCPPVIDIVKLNNQIMLVEDIIQGVSLKQLIKNNRLWSESDTIENLKYTLESLNIFHQNNFLHGNINPENIIQLLMTNPVLLITNLDVNIVDRGDLIETVTVEDRLYLSPEKIRGKLIYASDIYSLGMVIITMIIGKKIYELKEDEEGKIIWEQEIKVNNKLVYILNKMIAPQISKRYQNIEEILIDINNYLSSVEQKSSGQNHNQYSPTEIIIPTPLYQHSNTSLKNNLLRHNLSSDILRTIKTPQTIVIIITTFLIVAGAFLKTYLYYRKVNNIITDLHTFYSEKKYDDCIALIDSDKVQSLSIVTKITEQFLDKCRLGLAQTEANKNNYSEAIDIALKIAKNSQEYDQSLQYIDDWSGKIIEKARDIKENQNNLNLALETLNKVPQSSSRKKEALDLSQKWKGKRNTVIPLCPGPLCPN
ncbi:protein kinase domain-containing protein [Geminocystis sp. NIES-3709]|uniref:protein kinase domain-containing protein n=1 Tax=Geminocystis sp. NIES-3709 TaxID=1617448 RepID=UPI0005FC4A1E|nr:protein kinase [Geminocystis sp. NIES-3709]BAQ63865.1 serine/threonine kinase [Geminocystis sp. NIES-3709]